MILCHPQIETVLNLSGSLIPSVVIEVPSFYRALLSELYAQQSREDGAWILSDDDKDLPIRRWVEIIDNCLQIGLNTKPILNQITAELGRAAETETFLLKTAAVFQHLERYINDLAFSFDCDIVCGRGTVAGLLKAMGISLRDEYENPLERLVEYLRTVEYSR